jgi:Fic family protein
MAALCAFANAPTATASEPFLHPVLRAIAIHFQLGYDHPFVDGNGRTARALFYWSMLRAGYWLTEFLSISSVLKKAPAQYSRAYLLTESDATDLSYFAAHHLTVLSKAVDGLHAYIARKANEQRKAEALLHPGSSWGGRLNHRQRELLLHAVRNPGGVFRIAEHQRSTQVTYQTARSDLLGLQRAGLFDLHKQGRSFAFTPKQDLASILGV